MDKVNPIHVIACALAGVILTVVALGYYGYLHVAKPEDALLLAEFTMLKTIEGEDYRTTLKPAEQTAVCIDGYVVLFDNEKQHLAGVLVDNKKRIVRCQL